MLWPIRVPKQLKGPQFLFETFPITVSRIVMQVESVMWIIAAIHLVVRLIQFLTAPISLANLASIVFKY